MYLTRTRGYASAEPQHNGRPTGYASAEPQHTGRPTEKSTKSSSRNSSPSRRTSEEPTNHHLSPQVSSNNPSTYPPQPSPPQLPVYPFNPPSLPRDPSFPELEPSKPFPPDFPKGIDVACQPCLPRELCLKLAYCSIFSSLIGLFLIFTILFSGILQPVQGSKKVAPSQTLKLAFNTAFCKGVTVSGDVATVGLYTSDPPLNASVDNHFIRQKTVESEKYVLWSWDLQLGSSVNISVCSNTTNYVNLMVFEGEDNFNGWVEKHNNTTPLYQTTIDSSCMENNYETYSLVVRSVDVYYFVFYNPAKVDTTFTAVFDMSRVEYDTSNPIQECSFDCSLLFNYNSNQFIIAQALDALNPDDVLELNWKCIPIPIYLALFIGVTFICCFLPLWVYVVYWPVACWLYCKKRCKYREEMGTLEGLYQNELEHYRQADQNYEIAKPLYENARVQWYATQFSMEKERLRKEYTDKCIKYDRDKADWTRTVYTAEKERLMKEYELSLKTWMELYGRKPSSYPCGSSLTAPLLGGARSVSVPVAFTINDMVSESQEAQ